MTTTDDTQGLEAARAADLPEVLELLREAELPTAGVEEHVDGFLLLRDGEALVGCVGLEVYDGVGLLRSLAVQSSARGGGTGRRLVEGLIDVARVRELESLYLLTTTADRYFPRFGFEPISREDVDERLKASEELRGACPDTAICMRRRL